MHPLTTPLRYPGGKGQLANFIKLLIRMNGLQDGHYAEVYAGGAAVAFSLLFEDWVTRVFINDIDPAIYSFWSSVIGAPEDLCRAIIDTPVNMQQWKTQKGIHSDPHNHDPHRLAFATFFLNRTNRSGILKGGVIGGKAQDGRWRLDARYNKRDLVDRIQRIARRGDRISVSNLDAADFLTTIVPTLNQKALVFLDPPYYRKGEGLYEHHYSHVDHVKISKLLSKSVHRPWVVSYDDVPEIRSLYSSFKSQQYSLSYSAQERYKGAEIMFFCHGLVVPPAESPLRISSNDLTMALESLYAS